MELIIMKKQIIAAAVAATVSAAALADISITGNANYEFFHVDTTNVANNSYGDSEVNLMFKGTSGDTTVVANLELDSHGNGSIDVEDNYIKTKIGDITVQGGNWASSGDVLMGEIDAGERSTDKVALSTTVEGMTIGYSVSEVADSSSAFDGRYNSAAAKVTVSGEVMGQKIQLAEQSNTATDIGISGSAMGVNYRLEQRMSDTVNNDVIFGDINTKIGGMTLGYAWVDADTTSLIKEGDSALFAVSMNNTTDTGAVSNTNVTGIQQVTVATEVGGNSVKVRMGSLENFWGAGQDSDFSEINVSRKLASGANLQVNYESKDASAAGATTTDTLEVELNVSF
jgi:hypothetical protein